MKVINYLIISLILLAGGFRATAQTVTVSTLLSEMTDLRALAEHPTPWFKQSQASSYDRKSHEGGEQWFANYDVGQYVRAEVNDGRNEKVLADLSGPGAISRCSVREHDSCRQHDITEFSRRDDKRCTDRGRVQTHVRYLANLRFH